MSWKEVRIGDFLKRSKIPIDIEDDKEYNRVTIRINHNGVSLRDKEIGRLIGTKKQFILKSGQFILSKIDARYGAFGIAPKEVEGAIITGNFWAYDVDFKKVNIEWFNQFTNSPNFYEVCERASSGITHRKYLDEKFFLNYKINLPSIEEQLENIEKIKLKKVSFSFLSTELTHQLTLVKKLRQQFLQEAMQGKLIVGTGHDLSAKKESDALSLSKCGKELLEKIKAEKEKIGKKEKPLPPIKPEEIPFAIPDNWVWCRLGEICEIVKGNLGIMKAKEGDYPLVALSEERLSHNEYQFDCKGVVIPLISSTGHGHASMKRIHYQEGKFAVGNILCCVYPKIKNLINEKVLYIYLDTYKERFFVEKMKGAANVSLKISSIAETPIPLIPYYIQIKLEQLMHYCDNLENSIKQSQQQNEKLLQQVLREALRGN